MNHDTKYHPHVSAKEDHCNLPTSEALLAALEEFNRGEWYECHEILEELWIGSEGEIRDFYQGALQLAVALYHWKNGNFGGSVSLLKGGGDLLRRVGPVCQRVDVAALVAGADLLREELVRLGPERMGELDAGLIPKMRLVAASE